jgi:ATP-dependent exoDNAse (exonuclease V) alpha subunit
MDSNLRFRNRSVPISGQRELITVIGHAAVIAAGEWVTASGEWVNDRTHGQQFKSCFMRTSAPKSIEGIEKYLGSGMIRGIGPVYAKKMVKAFGEKVCRKLYCARVRFFMAWNSEARTAP